MQELNTIIIKNIKDIRKQRKITQKEMGEVIGVNQSQYAKYEKEIQYMNILQVCRLLKFLKVDLEEIVKD